VTDLQDVVYGYMSAQILHVAARLNLADELAGGACTLAELAAASGTHPPSLRRLLHGLVCLDVVDEPEADTFELTARGAQLRSDVPGSIRAAALLFCSEAMWRSWNELEHSVRTGEIAWDRVHGSSVFDYMDRNGDESTTFNAAMADRTRAVAPRIVASYDFAQFGVLADIGGGNGQLLAEILAVATGTRGILFDQPAGVAEAAQVLAGVAGRCDVQSGDFFQAVPTGADAYLLKSVIHNWDDDQAGTILRNCRKAMSGDGKLVLVERVRPARVGPAASRMIVSDINMLVNTHGRERTEAEFAALFAAAGFELTGLVATGEDLADYRVLVGSPV
jgi:SAM-dependent methyltransferase